MTRDDSDQRKDESLPNAASDHDFAFSSKKRNDTLDSPGQHESAGDEIPVMAELVNPAPGPAHGPRHREYITAAKITEPGLGLAADVWVHASPQNLPPILQNISAVGGAVGSMVLGTWAILGSLLTPYSGINGLLGLVLGLWGLSSRKRPLAIIGIVLSLIAIGMSVLKVSEFITIYVLNPEQGL